jgi:PD-(D/E)XK nuclease superfamily
VESAAIPAEPKPFKLSWSRLKELEECRAKGWLHYQKKFAEQRDNRAFFPGTVVDRVMRRWLEAAEQVPGAMVAMVNEVFDHEEATTQANGDGIVRWKHTRDRQQTQEDCRECVRRLEPILLRDVVPHEYQVAARFSVPISLPYQGAQRDMMLGGEMDLMVIEGAQYDGPGVRVPGTGVLKIKDLKMTKNAEYWRQTYPQLIFYEIAAWLMKLGWSAESSLIQPMCEQPVLSFVFGQEHRTEMLSRIVRASEYWWNGDHSPKVDNAGCAYCPAKLACPKMVVQGSRRVLGLVPVSQA